MVGATILMATALAHLKNIPESTQLRFFFHRPYIALSNQDKSLARPYARTELARVNCHVRCTNRSRKKMSGVRLFGACTHTTLHERHHPVFSATQKDQVLRTSATR